MSPCGRRCQKARLVKIWATLLGPPELRGGDEGGDIWQVEVLEVLRLRLFFFFFGLLAW